jgi:hypothetical protein
MFSRFANRDVPDKDVPDKDDAIRHDSTSGQRPPKAVRRFAYSAASLTRAWDICRISDVIMVAWWAKAMIMVAWWAKDGRLVGGGGEG